MRGSANTSGACSGARSWRAKEVGKRMKSSCFSVRHSSNDCDLVAEYV
jgi:hypothetical protein